LSALLCTFSTFSLELFLLFFTAKNAAQVTIFVNPHEKKNLLNISGSGQLPFIEIFPLAFCNQNIPEELF
jgi:hypothetical protein